MTVSYYVSPVPPFKRRGHHPKLMGDFVIIAFLVPMVLKLPGLFFGYQSLIVMAVSVAHAVVLEHICRKVMKRDNTITDLSCRGHRHSISL